MEATERQVGGGVLRVDATPCRKVLRCPYAVARERGGNLRTRVWVSRGIPWIYPRERARRKVEREGEPKLRWWYATKRAAGREAREKRAVLGDRGIGRGGTEKNQSSEERALDPVRKWWGEEGVSKRDTEVEVKMA